MATRALTTSKANGGVKTQHDASGSALYLQLTEKREHGYYHQTARVCTQKYTDSVWQAEGVDDSYSDGLLWSGLRVTCQGNDSGVSSRVTGSERERQVYAFQIEYCDVYQCLDLRRVTRMQKTLAKIEAGLEKLETARGRVTSYGEYVGRVAEVLGCAGMAIERSESNRRYNPARWEWMPIGLGVNAINHAIYRWQQEAVEAARQLEASGAGERRQLVAGAGDGDDEAVQS